MNRFDRIIKQKVEHAESAYPQEIWQKIHAQLPKKKKRFPGLWFFVTFLLLAAMGLLFMVTRQGSNSVAGLSQQDKMAQSNLPLSTLQSSGSNDDKELTEIISTPATGVTNSIAIKSIKDGRFTTNSAKVASAKLRRGVSLSSGSEVTALMVSHSNGESMQAEKHFIEDHNGHTFDVMQRAAVFQSPLKSDFYHVFGTDQSDVIEEINHTMKKHAMMKCPTFVRKENVSWLEVYFSNDYAIRSLEPKNTEAQAYADARDKTEKPYLSYSAGIRLGMGWNNGVALKSGVNYSRINEKFTYTDPNSMQIKTITIIKYIYDDQFNIIDSVKTTENVSIPGSNTVTNYNHISLIDIPVLFQYTMPGKKRLSYSATIGPLINVGISQSGKILNKEGNSLISLDNNDLIKRNIGLSFYGSFAINYQLTRNIQIAFEPNFRFIPTSLSNLNYPLEQKYFLANVAAAFKYKI